MKSPIRKLLILTNQSSSDSLIYFFYRCFGRSKYANIAIRKKTQDPTFVDIDFSDFYTFKKI